MDKLSIIIPTLQKCKYVLNKLIEALISNSCVGGIILIDNSCRGYNDIVNKKLKVIVPGSNLYINQSLNLGIDLCSHFKWGFINDDILIPDNLLIQVNDFLNNKDVGIIGLDTNINKESPISEFDKYPQNSIVEFLPLKFKQSINFYGSVVFGTKDSYYSIPRELKVLYGIDYLLLKNQENKKTNYEIVNIDVKHLQAFSINQSSLISIKERDTEFYDKIFNKKNKRKINKIFSITNRDGGMHRCITFLGIKFVTKIKTKFPKDAISCKSINRDYNSNAKRACIFALFNKNSTIDDNTINLLTQIRKFTDYIIIIGDNPILKSEINKINKLVDSYIFKRHNEYDFGSYKIGFNTLNDIGLLNKIDNILFINDSTIYLNKSLEKLFSQGFNHDFYGLTQNIEIFDGYDNYSYAPHLQSFCFFVSRNVFLKPFFKNFIQNIKKKKNKFDVIKDYEIGLSKIMIKNGFKLNSYYPKAFSPETYYLNPYSTFNEDKKLFYKKYKWKEICYIGR